MTGVDWNRYRKCTVCFAALGEQCTVMTGYAVDALGRNRPVIVPAAAPHMGRKLRVGAR